MLCRIVLALYYIDASKRYALGPMIIALTLFAAVSPPSGRHLTPASASRWRREVPDSTDTPDLRTTQSIAWSCVATIFACAWVAIHPNLPDPRISRWSRLRRRIGVMIVALFAPEFMLIWALRQRIGAGSIAKKYNRAIRPIDHLEYQKSFVQHIRDWFHAPPPPLSEPIWTLAHGFYVQMGGFVLYDRERAVRVLYFPDLLELVRSGVVDGPSVTEEDICDRSKGDFLAKSLVVIQTTWFIVQCLARWTIHLPVIELEVMTLAFAVMNIIMYWLWWEKPQNVSVAVRVQMKEQEIDPQDIGSGLYFDTDGMDITDTAWPIPPHPMEAHERNSDSDSEKEGTGYQHQLISDDLGWTGGQYQGPLLAFPQSVWIRGILTVKRSLHSFCKGIVRLALFRQVREVVLGPLPQLLGASALPETTIGELTLSVGTFYAYDATHRRIGLVAFAVASGTLFGGLHLIPWGFTFPTHTESFLWRISALYITINPILLSLPLLVSLLAYSNPAGKRSRFRAIFLGLFQPYWTLQPFRVIAITVPLYIVARILIIFLAFVTLRYLPPGAYTDISWSSFVPHI